MDFLSALEPWLVAHGFSRLPQMEETPDDVAFVNEGGIEVVIYADGATMYNHDYHHTRAVVVREGEIFHYGSLGGYLAGQFEKAAVAAVKG